MDGYVLLGVWAALALATVRVPMTLRLSILWAALGFMALIYAALEPVAVDYRTSAIGRGAMLGAVMALPILALLAEPLRLFVGRLYATQDVAVILLQVVFAAAPTEELFFRGILQPDKGLAISLGLYVAAVLLMLAPHVPFVALLIATLGLGVLGLVYAYVRQQHGLAAAVACRLVATTVLMLLPFAVAGLRQLLA
jgi:membrane protease YdiL (CAAX protease family)